ETAHPFYDKYYEIVKHRLRVTLRAHYAKSVPEFLGAIGDEKIDYYIFNRKKFQPEQLSKATYFAPFDALVRELTSENQADYAYFDLTNTVDSGDPSYLVFSDSNFALIDLGKLRSKITTEQ